MAKKIKTIIEEIKPAKNIKIEIKKIHRKNKKFSYRPRYIFGSWKGGSETKKQFKVSYKPRYVPGSWTPYKSSIRVEKPRYIPGSWKGIN